MAWKASFAQGVSSFRAIHLDEALSHFSLALKEQGGDKQYIIYDSRAAVYEKLSMPKEALRDAKVVITLAPDQWHGYARAARLFLLAHKLDAALKMANMALDRVKVSNTARRTELVKLKDDILKLQQEEDHRKRTSQNQFEKLPVELLGEMFYLVVCTDVAQLIGILHTCRYWRNAALSNPILWEKLILTPKSPGRKLRLWLTQSRGRIRELYVRSGVGSLVDWPFDELAQLPWNKLRVCSVDSWRVAEYLDKTKFICGEDLVFSGLESLEMIERYAGQRHTGSSLWPKLKKARVRSLSLSRSNVSWKQLSDLNSLTMLNIDTCSDGPQDLLPALKANSDLEKLMIQDYFTYAWDTETEPVHLPALKHLELQGSWSFNLLEYLRLPALEVLSIRASRSFDSAIRTLVTCSAPLHLTHLTLHTSPVASGVLISLLKHTPMLAHLRLVSLHSGVNAVIEGLAGPAIPPAPLTQTVTGEVKILCPALTHLDVSHSQDLRTGPLVRLVRSRLPPAPLSQTGDDDTETGIELPKKCERILGLTIDGCEQVEADWLPWFRKQVPAVSCVFHSKKKATWR